MGPIWRKDLSFEEIKEVLEAIEEARAFFHGTCAAFQAYNQGEAQINSQKLEESLREKNKYFASLIQRLSMGWG